MKRVLVICTLLLCALCIKKINEFPMEDGLVQVNDDNIDDILDSTYELLLVFCQRNLPKCMGYREPTVKAARMLAHLETPVYIGEVNMGTSFEVVNRYNATEYPEYINVYSFGRDPEKLKFPISDISIAKVAMSHAHTEIVEIKTMEDWEFYSTSLSIIMIGIFDNNDCEEYETYDRLAYGKSNAVFFYSFMPELHSMFNIDSYGLIAYHHIDDDSYVQYNGDMTNYNSLSDFVDMNELPLVIDYSQKEVAREVFNNQRIRNQLVLFYNPSDDNYLVYMSEFLKVAKELLGETFCIKANLKKSERLMRYFSIFEYPKHGFVLHSNSNTGQFSRRYLYEGDLVAADLRSFVDRAMRQESSLHRIFTSEPLPSESDNRRSCRKVVQQTFERDVLNPENDVFVLYMTSRCDPCIQVQVTLYQFAEDYEETENLKFYYAYTDRNDFNHKSVKIDSYPAIRFYPRTTDKTKKKWVNYREEMTIAGMERFLRKYATVELPEPEDDDEL